MVLVYGPGRSRDAGRPRGRLARAGRRLPTRLRHRQSRRADDGRGAKRPDGGGQGRAGAGAACDAEHGRRAGSSTEILAKEGDRVTAGQVILRLQNQRQQAALAEADAALATAQAQLDTAEGRARASQEIRRAQASLDAANGARWRDCRKAAASGGPGRGASGNLARPRRALRGCTRARTRTCASRPRRTLANAEAAVASAQAAFDKVKGQPNVGMLPQSLQLEQATNAFNAAKARYDELFAEPKARPGGPGHSAGQAGAGQPGPAAEPGHAPPRSPRPRRWCARRRRSSTC